MILSVLLVAVISVGLTTALFTDKDDATGTITMGGSVVASFTPIGEEGSEQQITLTTPDGQTITPGKKLQLTSYANFAQSSSTAILRFQIDYTFSNYQLATKDETISTEQMLAKIEQAKTKLKQNVDKLFNDSNNSEYQFYEFNGYYYVIDKTTLNKNTTTIDKYPLKVIDSNEDAQQITLFENSLLQLPGAELDNHFQGSSLKITITMQALQSNLYENGNLITLTPANVQPFYNAQFN